MNLKKSKKSKYLITIIWSFLIAIVAGIIAIYDFPKNLENMAEDALYQNPDVIPSDIIIIAIDEETLAQLGPYTDWDRSYFAQLIEMLNEDPDTAPQIIGIDVVFSGTNDTKEDEELVRVCAEGGNVVLASALSFDSYLYKGEDGQYYSSQYVSGEGKPYDELAAVTEQGFTNAIYDDDGFVRRTYTQIKSEYEGETTVYSSFAYSIASRVDDVKSYDSKVEVALVGNPGEFEIISMASVLDGTVPRGYFDDSIVLIGAFEEGMMDSYRVPIDYSTQMYGVELQANYIHAFLNDRIIYSINSVLQFFITFLIVGLFTFFALNSNISYGIVGLLFVGISYILACFVVFNITSYKLNLLSVPIGVAAAFLVVVIYKYIEMQKIRIDELGETLFSMAEAMAETIEGRTPYNANHTKNVAKRCVEMLDFINLKHKENKTDLHFTKEDKQELYLAAMLHDVGKMDVPLSIMDKPTKLGVREDKLKDRLLMISLRIKNDILTGYITEEDGNKKLSLIDEFVAGLSGFNCGRPLKEEEWELVNKIAGSVYVGSDGSDIPYMTQEEVEDLHIKAGTLSEKERTIMQSHVEYTDKILAHIQFGEQFKNVRAMAANHHELLNGKGYPKGMKEDELDVMTRILTIMDIYDSLIADDRPYKKPKSVKVAFEILDEEAKAGKIDKELLAFAKELYLKEE